MTVDVLDIAAKEKSSLQGNNDTDIPKLDNLIVSVTLWLWRRFALSEF